MGNKKARLSRRGTLRGLNLAGGIPVGEVPTARRDFAGERGAYVRAAPSGECDPTY
jgi:hypothetical protein